ncbi:hypothetical protein ADS79_05870 [Brevibacillus reuszeri]|uniref:Uncharacterized protein n=1 Tax=Brevibacillus reuszeri TaxID=54915 RepID=A0A0K9YXU3_9BACL|nr:hypothetical protein ADS79_05870 [Brevibacillus reuszeri]
MKDGDDGLNPACSSCYAVLPMSIATETSTEHFMRRSRKADGRSPLHPGKQPFLQPFFERAIE